MESLECVPEECWKSLASLESLRISKCPGLTSLSKAATTPPPLGTRHQSNLVDLDSEELDLSNYDESSGGNNNHHLILELHSLRSVDLFYLPKLASLPQWLLQASNLEDLSIRDCEELDICKDESGNNNNLILDSHGGLHHSLRSVDLYKLPKLASLPQWLLQASNLEDLSIWDCEELDLCKDESGNNNLILDSHGGLHHSLRSVNLYQLPKLASLPQWLLQASNLEHLSIRDCEELDICKDESGNNNLILDSHGGLHHSLRSVDFYKLPKLASLPQWLLQASNLEHLSIRGCDNLKALPEQIEALQSLRELQIRSCPSLTSLPEGMRRLASLTYLGISDCPELERRCKRDGGEDWDKIAHIPRIEFG
ncbi:hypothetical protein NL676_029714 [Syzygium grande]|nr:hypothetical protein NL676_029714 [Syzygium grande]